MAIINGFSDNVKGETDAGGTFTPGKPDANLFGTDGQLFDYESDPENTGHKSAGNPRPVSPDGKTSYLQVGSVGINDTSTIPGTINDPKYGLIAPLDAVIKHSDSVYTGPTEARGDSTDWESLGLVAGAALAFFAPAAMALNPGATGMMGTSITTGSTLGDNAVMGAVKGWVSGGGSLSGAVTGGLSGGASGLINGADIGGSVDEFGNPTGQYAVGSNGSTPASSVDVAAQTDTGPNPNAQALTIGNDPSLGLDNSQVMNVSAPSAADNFLSSANENDMQRGAFAQASDPAKFADLQSGNTFGAPSVNVATGGQGKEVMKGANVDEFGNPIDSKFTGGDTSTKDLEAMTKTVSAATTDGTLDKALAWIRQNKELAGMLFAGAASLGKGLLDKSNLELKSELDVKTKAQLLDMYNKNVQASGIGGGGVNIGIGPSNKPLTRLSTGGLINGTR